MATRAQNERRYAEWQDLPDGGRRYTRVVKGRTGGYARYVKLVDAEEVTHSIVQEIYDSDDRLIAVHRKFPDDAGHQDVSIEEGRPE